MKRFGSTSKSKLAKPGNYYARTASPGIVTKRETEFNTYLHLF